MDESRFDDSRWERTCRDPSRLLAYFCHIYHLQQLRNDDARPHYAQRLKGTLREGNIQSVLTLQNFAIAAQEAWDNVPQHFIVNFIHGVPRLLVGWFLRHQQSKLRIS